MDTRRKYGIWRGAQPLTTAQRRLATSLYPHAHQIATQVARSLPPTDRDDLISYAGVLAMRAAQQPAKPIAHHVRRLRCDLRQEAHMIVQERLHGCRRQANKLRGRQPVQADSGAVERLRGVPTERLVTARETLREIRRTVSALDWQLLTSKEIGTQENTCLSAPSRSRLRTQARALAKEIRSCM